MVRTERDMDVDIENETAFVLHFMGRGGMFLYPGVKLCK
jgi:hypothetical protein